MSAAEGARDADTPGEIEPAGGVPLIDLIVAMVERWRLLLFVPIVAGAAGLGATFVVDPTYTARTTILPPATQQSAAAGALAALGNLGVLAGGGAAPRTPTDQLVALLQSETIADSMIDRFGLLELYRKELRMEARRVLRARSRITAGRKDGLITIEVDDKQPARAAEMANQYVEELRRLTSTLAVTEAQQRRAFFQTHLEKTRDELARAQRALQASGFDGSALRAEPRAAAEEYARVKAEATAAEVRLQTLSTRLTASTPEVQQAQSALATLRAKLSQLERSNDASRGVDYVGRFREFKYQETLYDMFARQYELARVDESREGALIQIVDKARPPEWKSAPKRAVVTVVTAIVSALVVLLWVAVQSWHRLARTADPAAAGALLRISHAFRGR